MKLPDEIPDDRDPRRDSGRDDMRDPGRPSVVPAHQNDLSTGSSALEPSAAAAVVLPGRSIANVHGHCDVGGSFGRPLDNMNIPAPPKSDSLKTVAAVATTSVLRSASRNVRGDEETKTVVSSVSSSPSKTLPRNTSPVKIDVKSDKEDDATPRCHSDNMEVVLCKRLNAISIGDVHEKDTRARKTRSAGDHRNNYYMDNFGDFESAKARRRGMTVGADAMRSVQGSKVSCHSSSRERVISSPIGRDGEYSKIVSAKPSFVEESSAADESSAEESSLKESSAASSSDIGDTVPLTAHGGGSERRAVSSHGSGRGGGGGGGDDGNSGSEHSFKYRRTEGAGSSDALSTPPMQEDVHPTFSRCSTPPDLLDIDGVFNPDDYKHSKGTIPLHHLPDPNHYPEEFPLSDRWQHPFCALPPQSDRYSPRNPYEHYDDSFSPGGRHSFRPEPPLSPSARQHALYAGQPPHTYLGACERQPPYRSQPPFTGDQDQSLNRYRPPYQDRQRGNQSSFVAHVMHALNPPCVGASSLEHSGFLEWLGDSTFDRGNNPSASCSKPYSAPSNAVSMRYATTSLPPYRPPTGGSEWNTQSSSGCYPNRSTSDRHEFRLSSNKAIEAYCCNPHASLAVSRSDPVTYRLGGDALTPETSTKSPAGESGYSEESNDDASSGAATFWVAGRGGETTQSALQTLQYAESPAMHPTVPERKVIVRSSGHRAEILTTHPIVPERHVIDRSSGHRAEVSAIYPVVPERQVIDRSSRHQSTAHTINPSILTVTPFDPLRQVAPTSIGGSLAAKTRSNIDNPVPMLTISANDCRPNLAPCHILPSPSKIMTISSTLSLSAATASSAAGSAASAASSAAGSSASAASSSSATTTKTTTTKYREILPGTAGLYRLRSAYIGSGRPI